jgi:DNA-binding CsgD family transcriptional regulator
MNIDQAALARLTEKQRECLHLVQYNYSSKEIGRKLGISPYAVDQRLRLATRQLQAPSRFAAARMLKHAEASEGDNSTYHSMIYATPHLEQNTPNAINKASGSNRDQQPDSHGLILNDAQVAYDMGNINTNDPWTSYLVSAGRGFLFPHSMPAQVFLLLVITIVSLFAFSAVVAGLEVLSRI